MRDWVPKSFEQKVCAVNSFNASLAPAWVENCFGGLELVCKELHGLSRPFLGLVSVELLPFPPSPRNFWALCLGGLFWGFPGIRKSSLQSPYIPEIARRSPFFFRSSKTCMCSRPSEHGTSKRPLQRLLSFASAPRSS